MWWTIKQFTTEGQHQQARTTLKMCIPAAPTIKHISREVGDSTRWMLRKRHLSKNLQRPTTHSSLAKSSIFRMEDKLPRISKEWHLWQPSGVANKRNANRTETETTAVSSEIASTTFFKAKETAVNFTWYSSHDETNIGANYKTVILFILWECLL